MERMKNLSERLRRVGMLQEADFFFWEACCLLYPIGSMGLVYLPTFTLKINQM